MLTRTNAAAWSRLVDLAFTSGGMQVALRERAGGRESLVQAAEQRRQRVPELYPASQRGGARRMSSETARASRHEPLVAETLSTMPAGWGGSPALSFPDDPHVAGRTGGQR